MAIIWVNKIIWCANAQRIDLALREAERGAFLVAPEDSGADRRCDCAGRGSKLWEGWQIMLQCKRESGRHATDLCFAAGLRHNTPHNRQHVV